MMAAPRLILLCSFFLLLQTAYKHLRQLQVGDLALIVIMNQSCLWVRMPNER
jgi:hypothetical protein